MLWEKQSFAEIITIIHYSNQIQYLYLSCQITFGFLLSAVSNQIIYVEEHGETAYWLGKWINNLELSYSELQGGSKFGPVIHF